MWEITFERILFGDFKLMSFKESKLVLNFDLIGIPEYFMKWLKEKILRIKIIKKL